MWMPAAVLFCLAMTMHEMHRFEFDVMQVDQGVVVANQALIYSKALTDYMRTNPLATGNINTSLLTTLPTWFPKTCSSDVCFQSTIIGGYGYITSKSSAPIQVTLSALDKAQDGSLIVGSFANISPGLFNTTSRGSFNLPADATVTINKPTLVVRP